MKKTHHLLPTNCPNALSRSIRGGWLLLLCGLCGCGSKDAASTDEPVAEKETPLQAQADTDHVRERRGRRHARRDRNSDAQAARKRGGRGGRWRQYAARHRYMRLAIDKLELSDQQLETLADLNWKHFEAQQKKAAERASLNDALLGMLGTGTFDGKPFETDQAWLAANDALELSQYRERLTVLHQTLTREQRDKLVKLVEADQKRGYAAAEKRLATAKTPRRPVGCGGRGDRFIYRFADRRSLNGPQRKQLSQLRAELDKTNPDADVLANHREARRVFDTVVRKAFLSRTLDASKLTPPRMSHTEPVAVSKCHQQEFQTLLKLLTPEQREKAAQRLKQRMARRQGADAGVESEGSPDVEPEKSPPVP